MNNKLKIVLPFVLLTVFASGCAVSPERNNFCAPSTLSPEMAVTVNANTPPLWQVVPQNINEWHNLPTILLKQVLQTRLHLLKNTM